MKIIAIDKEGKEGAEMTISKARWELMQLQFGKNLRWKLKEIKNERKKRRDTSVSVEKD